MIEQLPVTVVAGTPGSDETWLVDRVRAFSNPRRVTAIVPMRRRERTRSPGLLPTTPRLVRLGKGCSCCTVRGDLLTKVRRIASEDTADHILIQAPTHADLVTLAKTFTVADDRGEVLSSVARIQGVVLVVNGRSLRGDLQTSDGHLLVERIQLADVIVLCGGATHDSVATVRALNPHARVHGDGNDLSLEELRTDEAFDLASAQRRTSLADVLDEAHSVHCAPTWRGAS